MINLSTPNKDILKELNEDYEKLGYWMKKKVGSEKKLAKLKDRIVREYHRTGKNQTSDPIEYISTNGNRWYGYYRTFNIGGIVYAHSAGFCYYETYGSIGAFVPINSKSVQGCDGVVIFPSHFFLRLSQRLGVGVRSREVVKRFLEMLDNMVIQYKGDSEVRKDEVEVSFSGSVWRGQWRGGDSSVIELNTFLKHTELSKSQNAKAVDLQNKQMTYIPRSKETDLQRLMTGGAESWVNELLDNVNDKGGVFDFVSSAYYNYFNTTHFTGEEVGIKITAENFDELLKAESRGENRLGMVKFIYEHAYELIPEDEFFNKVFASVFVVLRKLGYKGTIDDLRPHFEVGVKRFAEWREEMREKFNAKFKK
jgi:hypothetical protein